MPTLKMPTILPSKPLERIMTALNLAPERRPTTTTPVNLTSQIPPQWVPDNKAAACAGCGTDFGLLVRKHHCRGCGRVMCHNCTQKSRVLSQYRDYYGPHPQRVCERCDKRQTEIEAMAKRKRARHNRSISVEELRIRQEIRKRARELAVEEAERKRLANEGQKTSSSSTKTSSCFFRFPPCFSSFFSFNCPTQQNEKASKSSHSRFPT
uniref:FYVE-type domain-containing protein n=2 Tax=Lotharella globosa TaxID=91324 RepID=A0A7S3YQ00_9EUKA